MINILTYNIVCKALGLFSDIKMPSFQCKVHCKFTVDEFFSAALLCALIFSCSESFNGCSRLSAMPPVVARHRRVHSTTSNDLNRINYRTPTPSRSKVHNNKLHQVTHLSASQSRRQVQAELPGDRVPGEAHGLGAAVVGPRGLQHRPGGGALEAHARSTSSVLGDVALRHFVLQ